jgi:hypothetical protein
MLADPDGRHIGRDRWGNPVLLHSRDGYVSTLVGDVNDDETVDVYDLFRLSRAFGSDPLKYNWNPRCDFNGDGVVDDSDLVSLGDNYGKAV